MNERGALSALEALIAVDVAAADGDMCEELRGLARAVRGRVDAAEVQISSRLRALHDAAGGASAADQHTRCGAVSASDVPFDRCEIHHILPWELGGPTDLHDLVPLCSRHHDTVHEFDWTLEPGPDRTLTIRRPDGAVFTVWEPDVPPERSSHRTRRRAAA